MDYAVGPLDTGKPRKQMVSFAAHPRNPRNPRLRTSTLTWPCCPWPEAGQDLPN